MTTQDIRRLAQAFLAEDRSPQRIEKLALLTAFGNLVLFEQAAGKKEQAEAMRRRLKQIGDAIGGDEARELARISHDGPDGFSGDDSEPSTPDTSGAWGSAIGGMKL